MMQPTELAEKNAMVKRLRRIARELGTTSVSRAEFLRRSGVTDRKLQRLFGRYNRLVETAGLVPLQFRGRGALKYSHQETLAEIQQWDFKELPGHPYRLFLSAKRLSAMRED